MKTLIAGLSLAFAAFGAQAQKVVELDLGHVLSARSHYNAAATKLAEVALAKSKGTLKINVFSAGQLGGEVKLIQSARTGVVALAVTGEAPLENTVKDFTVFSFPYLFDNLDQADALLQGPIGREMLDLLPRYGLMGLGWISAIERNVYTNNKDIPNAAAMKDLKIRVIQSPGYVKAYEALGAHPTPMAYSELYVGLQNGVVDAAENSPDLFVQDRFIEVSKVYAMTKVHSMPSLILMSKARFDALSPEHQKVLKEAAAEAVPYAIAAYRKDYADGLAAMRAANVRIVEPDAASFRATAPRIHEQLLKDFPQAKPWLERIQAAKQK